MISNSACELPQNLIQLLEKILWHRLVEKLFTTTVGYKAWKEEIIGMVECLKRVVGTVTNISFNTFF